MHQRCSNPKHSKYSRYGGRGIRVCRRWRKFENFLSDMGDRPEGMTLDRRDNDGPYSPDNCRWATPTEQRQNTSTYSKVLYGGKEYTRAALARELKIPYSTLCWRIRNNAPLTSP